MIMIMMNLGLVLRRVSKQVTLFPFRSIQVIDRGGPERNLYRLLLSSPPLIIALLITKHLTILVSEVSN